MREREIVRDSETEKQRGGERGWIVCFGPRAGAQHNLAMILDDSGRHAEACAIYEAVLAERERELGRCPEWRRSMDTRT